MTDASWQILTGDCVEPGTGTVPRLCRVCQRTYDASVVRLRHGRQTTCSRACSYELRAQARRQQVALTCVGCGTTFTRNASHANSPSGKGKFCTRACRDAHRVADLHPQYLGGPTGDRGPNWQAQKRKARKRDDGICQACGRAGTDVHHVRPFRMFADYRLANALENLILLCRPCHRRADAELQAAAST
jgi:hypothetical protein